MLSFGRPVGIDAFGNRVAMDPKRFSGVGDALLVSHECFLNIELFELVERFIQEDVAVEHVFN